MPFPRMIKVKQELYRAGNIDIAATVQQELARVELPMRLRPGMKIAVTAGSRGIAGLPEVLRAIVAFLREHATQPFIVPAMGSHGGATAAGQVEVLKSIGVTEKSVGAPIVSDMATVKLGESRNGVPVYFDRHAAQADGLIAVNRVKEHTDFVGDIESGLMKLVAIGLGKHKGAQTLHALGIENMSESVISACRFAASKLNFFFAVGLLEDAYHNLAAIEAFRPEELECGERRLLRRAKEHAPRLPFRELELLIVEQLGKEISGTGMDTNVIGRSPTGLKRPGPQLACRRIVALGLTKETKGNAVGLGLADLATLRLLQQMDLVQTYTNVLTSGNFAFANIPPVLENDKTAIEAALTRGINKQPEELRVVRIKDTLHLDSFDISEGLLAEARENPKLAIAGKPRPMRFDGKGKLL